MMDEIDFFGSFRYVSPTSLITSAPGQGINDVGNTINYLTNYNGRYLYDNFHQNSDLSTDPTCGTLFNTISHITGCNDNFDVGKYYSAVLTDKCKFEVVSFSTMGDGCSSNNFLNHDKVCTQLQKTAYHSLNPKGNNCLESKFKRLLKFIFPCFFLKSS